MDFPLITEVRPWRDTSDWNWRPWDSPGHSYHGRHFWLGTDSEGVDWLVKMRGASYAHREHSFARFAQSIGISCQTTQYVLVPDDSPPRSRDNEFDGECQLALWSLPEHGGEPCGRDCPMAVLESAVNGPGADPVQHLEASTIEHAVDWARSEMLASLCGSNEPSGLLFTPDHTLVVIDNEMMFSTGPASVWESNWLRGPYGQDSPRAVDTLLELCSRIVAIEENQFSMFAAPPGEWAAPPDRDIAARLRSTQLMAHRLLRSLTPQA